MLFDSVAFANLTKEQVNMVEHFEKEFNTKFGHDIFVLAFNNKK